jgi:NAD(P)-dependent dehydrogenase (short-subunit alcohol dehydrogenase family)
MKTIIITGSTRGIGYGLADAFLARGCRVVVSGRSQGSVDKAVASLTATHGGERLVGQPCDVTDEAAHQVLWDAGVSAFGRVDVWVNNAGIGHPMTNVWELPSDQVRQVIDVDLMGVIYGSRIAIQNMLTQGHGHLYNMEGFGSDGRTRAGLSIYGSTKSAVRFLSKSLTKELEGKPVKASTLSPGIVITEFITDQYKDDPAGLENAKRIFNVLGDKVETVTPWLAEKVLANDKSGAHFGWLTPFMVMKRFATARFNKRDLFS